MKKATGIRILVVDDDEDLASMLRTSLTVAGFSVTVCHDGEDGLRKAIEEKPDLVILDLMMPGKNGLEVMQEMRTDPSAKDTPILFLTAVDEESVVVQGLRGAEDYVTKPVRFLELETRIKKILERAGRGQDAPGPPTIRSRDRLPVHVGEETYFVPLGEIYFVEAHGKYSYVHTRQRRFLVGDSISCMEKKLHGDARFTRIHRSHIVNTEHIVKVTKDDRKSLVVVVGDEDRSKLRVSEAYRRSFREKLNI